MSSSLDAGPRTLLRNALPAMELVNFRVTLTGRGTFCFCHLGFSHSRVTLLASNQSVRGKIRLAQGRGCECSQA